jgi:hypothetical protein
MATLASIVRLGSLSSYRYGTDTYDSTKLGLGPMIEQYAGTGESAFVGPIPTAVARPMEQSTTIASAFPWAMRWQNNAAGEIDWIFFADNSAAAATRRINAYTFNRRTSVWTWIGFVTVTFPTATAYTIRGIRMTYELETTGTVAVSGTAVTGTSTLFSTNKVCVGNRIGFGSTDPTAITTWYEISAIGSDTSITLTATAGTVTAGSAYVIEDLRCIMTTTNATTTNGGLHVIKGLQLGLFSNVGGTVPAAVSTDNIRACYWLADAATVLNITSFGMGIAASRVNATTHYVYVLDTLANPIVYKYNIRAALTLASGKDTTSLVLKTGSGGALTGTPSQNNNGRLAVLGHGPHSGVEALYFTTTTRIYATPTTNITSASITWLSNGTTATEVPPGGINTFAATANLASLEYLTTIDKFAIVSNATTTPFRSYVTQYRTDAGQWDRLWGIDTRQIDQGTADASTTPIATLSGAAYSVFEVGGLMYVATLGGTAILNRIYAIPICADWEYTATTKCYAVLPAIDTSLASKITNIFANDVQVLGGATTLNLGLPTEPFRLSYRTAGITDDSGSWTAVNSVGQITQDGATQTQLRIEFRTIGTLGIPARICAVGVIFQDNSTDGHYQPSVAYSSITNSQFAWRFSTAFGSTVPKMRIRLYDAVSGGLLVDDDSVTQSGSWQKSTDNGSTWGAYNTTDVANTTTYIRFTPASLGSGIKVRALLTQF